MGALTCSTAVLGACLLAPPQRPWEGRPREGAGRQGQAFLTLNYSWVRWLALQAFGTVCTETEKLPTEMCRQSQLAMGAEDRDGGNSLGSTYNSRDPPSLLLGPPKASSGCRGERREKPPADLP